MAEQFDMFSEQVPRGHVVSRGSSKSIRIEKHAIPMKEEDMVRHLSETGRYRILQKLVPRAIAPFPRPGYPLKGIILDTETTGLNARKDEIIEIGVIAFTFDAKGNIGDVTGVYGGLSAAERFHSFRHYQAYWYHRRYGRRTFDRHKCPARADRISGSNDRP